MAHRLIITLFLILTVIFAILAQTSEATKGPKITHKVYFDITENETPLGRVVIGLYGKTVPKVINSRRI
jgi:peptidyl-prolyl cis-trans isomerase B (cyclophilin B)